MDLSKYIGGKIKFYRELNNLTQDDLAEELNTTRQSISRYENGDRKANQDVLFELADLFNISINKFFPEIKLVPPLETVIDKTTSIMRKLDDERQKNVYECAEEQLEEQQKEQTKPAQQSTQITNIQSYKDEKKRASESYGAVSAGTGEFLFGVERAETVYLPESDFPDEPFDYVLKINGDSMLPTYKDGEYIFVKSFSNGGNIRNGMLAIVMYDNEVYFKKLYFDDSVIRLVSLNKEYKDIVITDPSCFQVLGKVVA